MYVEHANSYYCNIAETLQGLNPSKLIANLKGKAWKEASFDRQHW